MCKTILGGKEMMDGGEGCGGSGRRCDGGDSGGGEGWRSLVLKEMNNMFQVRV